MGVENQVYGIPEVRRQVARFREHLLSLCYVMFEAALFSHHNLNSASSFTIIAVSYQLRLCFFSVLNQDWFQKDVP
jgi:hypothetical protein